MFGIHLPSVSDVKNAVTGAASTALHTTEDLGSAAVSKAADLGRQGLDLGRTAVDAVSHIDVQKLGSTAVSAIGKAEDWASNGIRTGVMDAGQAIHSAGDWARSHVSGSDPFSSVARGAITATEDLARFDVGAVGGVGQAAVGLVGSVGQLSVMAAEYQYSPSARAAINDKIVSGVESGAKAVGDYATSVANDPSRVVGDVENAAKAGAGWVGGVVDSAKQAIKDGHGPESFGLVAGNVATYLIPVGGEVRAAAGAAELGVRGAAEALAEDGARGLAETGAKAVVEDGGSAVAKSGAEAGAGAVARDAVEGAGRALDRAVAGGGSTAEARAALEALPQAQRFEALSSFVSRMDVSSAKDTATFWSGGVTTADGFVSSRGAADALAAAEGRVTLEGTPGGRVLDSLKFFDSEAPLVNRDQAMQLWETASARYAQAATGDVVAVAEGARPTSVWNRIERPILEQGLADGRVTSLDVRSPSSPFTK